MEVLTSRPAAGTGDLDRVIDLLRTCWAVEAIDRWPPLYKPVITCTPSAPATRRRTDARPSSVMAAPA